MTAHAMTWRKESGDYCGRCGFRVLIDGNKIRYFDHAGTELSRIPDCISPAEREEQNEKAPPPR